MSGAERSATVKDHPQRTGRIAARVDAELERELRNAVLSLSGPPHFLTITDVIEAALREHLDRLRRRHNGGKPFPEWASAVKRGRPYRP